MRRLLMLLVVGCAALLAARCHHQWQPSPVAVWKEFAPNVREESPGLTSNCLEPSPPLGQGQHAHLEIRGKFWRGSPAVGPVDPEDNVLVILRSRANNDLEVRRFVYKGVDSAATTSSGSEYACAYAIERPTFPIQLYASRCDLCGPTPLQMRWVGHTRDMHN